MKHETHTDLSQLLSSGKKRTRIRRLAIGTVALAFLAGAGVFFLKWQSNTAQTNRPQYVFESVRRGNLVATIDATGTVEALNTVEVGAEVSGTILSLHADFNDTVIAGQVLARIDPEQQKAAVNQARAQMLAARAQVAEADATRIESCSEAARAKELAQEGLLSSKELESAMAKSTRADATLQSAQASFALAKASFDAARSKLDRTEIASPISGTVLSRVVEVGQTLNAGMQTPLLFTIAEDLRRMQLSSRVDEADIGRVRTGQTATFIVDAYPGQTFASTVTSVRNVPQTDQNVVSYEVLLTVDNQNLLLKPGMTASVEIVTDEYSNVLLVSNRALRFSPQKATAFRGPPGGGIPLLRSAESRNNKAPEPDRADTVGTLKANEGLLWASDKANPSGIRPVRITKIASDGTHTALESPDLKEGVNVVVEQQDVDQGSS